MKIDKIKDGAKMIITEDHGKQVLIFKRIIIWIIVNIL